MKKYQIYEVLPEHHHAGTKAVKDSMNIAQEEGFQLQKIRLNNMSNHIVKKLYKHLILIFDWYKLLFAIKRDSVVLLQFPIKFLKFNSIFVLKILKKYKNIEIITLLHDLPELRMKGEEEKISPQNRSILQLSNVLIAHNSKMIEYLEKKGFSRDKIINLEIFDYLIDTDMIKSASPTFEKSLIIAGNLDKDKVGYLKKLDRFKETSFQLYGPNFDNSINFDNVTYNGSYPPEQLMSHLVSGFGLVWDGDSVETCSGSFGDYLKFNNPHKMSLYLSSALPVVVWSLSAQAQFVSDNKIGLTIDSLADFEKQMYNFTEKDYHLLVTNTNEVSKKLTSGYFLKKALCQAEELLVE
ncbi:TPA: glycosyl transferase [Streptococcus suis]